MAARGWLTYPAEDWRTWYADLLARMDDLTPADVLARWVAIAAPAYDSAGPRPADEVLATAPRDKYIEADGQWWVRDDEASAKLPARAGISFDVVGPYLRLPGGEIIRDRATARRRLGKLAADPMIATLLRLFLSGRQDDTRKTMSREILARAMVVLGLRDAGMSHLRAVRLWSRWEDELGGSLASEEVAAVVALGAKADRADRQFLREYERNVCGTNRRTWRQLGVTVSTPREFAPPE